MGGWHPNLVIDQAAKPDPRGQQTGHWVERVTGLNASLGWERYWVCQAEQHGFNTPRQQHKNRIDQSWSGHDKPVNDRPDLGSILHSLPV